MLLFILPLVLLLLGYGFGLWYSFRGRRLVRRFFFLPVVVSLAITAFSSLQYEQRREVRLPGHTEPLLPDNPTHFVPLYALRIAPIALGVCVIVNATGYFAMRALHRRFLKPKQSADGLAQADFGVE